MPPIVDNVWGWALHWIFQDVIDLITFGPHLYVGYREYFGGHIEVIPYAVFVIVGTFLDLRIFMLAFFAVMVLWLPASGTKFVAWVLRFLDRMPLIP